MATVLPLPIELPIELATALPIALATERPEVGSEDKTPRI